MVLTKKWIGTKNLNKVWIIDIQVDCLVLYFSKKEHNYVSPANNYPLMQTHVTKINKTIMSQMIIIAHCITLTKIRLHYPFPTYRHFLAPLQHTTTTKGEIAGKLAISPFATFSTLFNIYWTCIDKRFNIFLLRCLQSRLLQICCMWERVIQLQLTLNPFPHIDAFWRLGSRRLFENVLTKEEIA